MHEVTPMDHAIDRLAQVPTLNIRRLLLEHLCALPSYDCCAIKAGTKFSKFKSRLGKSLSIKTVTSHLSYSQYMCNSLYVS